MIETSTVYEIVREETTDVTFESSTDSITTTSSESFGPSVIGINSPVVVLIWFEIIAACFV